MKRLTYILAAITLCPILLLRAAAADTPATSSRLVISEVQTGGCSVDVGTAACPGANQLPAAEFVELTNLAADSLDVRGWTVAYVSSTGATTTPLATLDGTIAGGGFVLVAHAGWAGDADLTFGSATDSGKLAATAGYVALLDASGAIVDAVGWGSGTGAQFTAWPSTASVPYGYSISRILPGSPLYSTQAFNAPAFPPTPAGGAYTPAAPVDTVSPPPAPAAAVPGVIITALRFSDNAPVFIQLYNNTGAIADLRGWRLELDAHSTTDEMSITLTTLDRWLLPAGYAVIGNHTVGGADIIFTIDNGTLQQLAALPAEDVRLIPADAAAVGINEPITGLPAASGGQWWQRAQSGSGKYTVTGNDSDFTLQSGSADLYGNGLYLPPSGPAGLTIVEILPHTPDCSPVDRAATCNDYVKLYNAGPGSIDLSLYRLRTNTGGLKSSGSNTFALHGALAAGSYRLVGTKDDGTPLSLTDSGGYVWLEDAYGVTVYEPVVAYADASGKIGWAWAYDGTMWRWTTTPAPAGPNIFSPVSPANDGAAAAALLKPCAPGQERNPATNRCRSVGTASNTIQPCPAGQERNPSTNRCKSVLAASTTLQPCPAGQSRNPDTNRCRKDAAAPATVRDIPTVIARSSLLPWIVVIGIAAAATGYAFYEWRQELVMLFSRGRAWTLRIKDTLLRRLHLRS